MLIGRHFGSWFVRAQLEGGLVECVCTECRRVYERDAGTLVRGESKRCEACARAQRAG